jgi:hypothetical protein
MQVSHTLLMLDVMKTMTPRLVLAVLLLSAGVASASLVNEQAMQAGIDRYFAAEKNGALLLMSIGLFAVLFGLWTMLQKKEPDRRRIKAMGLTVMAVGLLELGVGGAVYFRTDAQVERLTRQLKSDPSGFALAEMKRIERVNRSFRMLGRIEIALMIGGALLFGVGLARRNLVLQGVGLGLAIQAAIALGFDSLAAQRALDYFRQLGMFRMFV